MHWDNDRERKIDEVIDRMNKEEKMENPINKEFEEEAMSKLGIPIGFESCKDVIEYLEWLRDLPKAQFKEYYGKHRDEILELLDIIEEEYKAYGNE